METRTTEQVKIYKLILNRMTSSKIEYSELAAVAYDRTVLVNWTEEQKGFWEDGQWGKCYRQGSALEWFNPPYENFEPNSFGHGIHIEWVNKDDLAGFLRERYDIPEVLGPNEISLKNG